MKIICTQENLLSGLSFVSHIAGRSTTLPILKNVLIRASAEGIVLMTTNLEIGITAQVRGKVESPGEFSVQARVILDYVSLLPAGNVTLELQNGELVIASADSKTTLKGLSGEDFPVIPKVHDGTRFSMPAKTLKTLLNQTVFAVAADEARPEINGVLFHLKEQELVVAATDSYRLAEAKAKLTTTKEEQKIIVPSRSLQEWLRIAPEAGEVNLTISDNQVCFSGENIELVSRLIEGQFPDYTQIIPAQFSTHLVLDNESLAKALRQVGLFCRSGINDVTLAYQSNNEITLSAANAQVGASDVKLPAEINDQTGKIVFNWRFLLDGLNVVGAEGVVLHLNDEKSPGLLEPKTTKEQPTNFRYLVMPIRQ
ncbi:DNA polymerase III subunit beta [Candidatus Parcubacteria bacterium]|jgi:DNA polymerase-3 subunit beta|nr:MAG: DNA polymerase III subunit beta [Candidatus Parcubacteria bacterium]